MTYDYWEKALADPKALHNREFRITNEPQSGFFRTYRLNEPVAIYETAEDGLIILVNGDQVDADDYENVWLSCAKNPVTEAAYHQAVETGRWPDLDEAVAAIGDNRRRGDEAAAIIDDLAGQAATYQEITDDDEARRAISLRAALQEQGKKIDKVREAEKAPHLKAAREVDEIYMTTVKLAKTWADYLRHLVEAFETKKRRMIKQAEDDRLAAIALDIMNDLSPEALAEPADQIRTGYGRAASVRTKIMVTGIRDLDEVLRRYRGDPRLDEALQIMAQEDMDVGRKVDGFIYEEVAVVR